LQRQSDQQSKTGQSQNSIQLIIRDSESFQNIYGYGAALTQSSAYILGNYKKSNEANYWNLLNSLFSTVSPNSAEMNVMRVPITASDMVVSDYFTYDEVTGDYSLNSESLSNDPYTIPILQDILKVHPAMKIIVCPWTAPVIFFFSPTHLLDLA
jgi:O-glycosyl hydrolase